MPFEERNETLTCETCGADHATRWSRMTVREPQKIDCLACGAVLFDRKSHRDYYQVRLAKV